MSALAHTKFIEGKPEPYTDIKKALASIAKENYLVLTLYSFYYVVVIVVLVHFLGKIVYGPNMPYITFLVLVGLPFLIAFTHLLSKVGNQSIRLIDSGFTEKQATSYRLKWMLIITVTMLFVIDLTFHIANLIR